MRKSIMFAVVIVAVSIFVSGCVGINTPVTGTMPGVIVTNTSAGIFINVPVRPLVEKYKIIKQHAVGTSVSVGWLGLVALGDSTYSAAFDDILENNPEADDVIDVKVDVKKVGVLMIATTTTLIVRGTAIKYLGERKQTEQLSK